MVLDVLYRLQRTGCHVPRVHQSMVSAAQASATKETHALHDTPTDPVTPPVPVTVMTQLNKAQALPQHLLVCAATQSCQADPNPHFPVCQWDVIDDSPSQVFHMGRCPGLIQTCPLSSPVQDTQL